MSEDRNFGIAASSVQRYILLCPITLQLARVLLTSSETEHFPICMQNVVNIDTGNACTRDNCHNSTLCSPLLMEFQEGLCEGTGIEKYHIKYM